MEGGGIFCLCNSLKLRTLYLHAIMYLPRADFFHITCPNSKGERLESELGLAHVWQVLQDAAELGLFWSMRIEECTNRRSFIRGKREWFEPSFACCDERWLWICNLFNSEFTQNRSVIKKRNGKTFKRWNEKLFELKHGRSWGVVHQDSLINHSIT